MTKALRILGIDPGSRIAGFGCVDRKIVQGRLKSIHVEHGVFRIEVSAEEESLALRLMDLHRQLSAAIERLRPHVLVVEKAFFAKNASSALKLGQARGVILLSGAERGLKVVELSPTEVKQTIANFGHAEKTQVAQMLRLILGPLQFETADASDGLALACAYSERLRVCDLPHSRVALDRDLRNT